MNGNPQGTMDRLYTITELAKRVSVTPRTIRYYETKGLLSPRRAGNTRVYSGRELARLKIVLRGKRLGFSLADIKECLDLYDVEPSRIGRLECLLEKVRQRVVELEAQRRDIEVMLKDLGGIQRQVADAFEERRSAVCDGAVNEAGGSRCGPRRTDDGVAGGRPQRKGTAR